MVRRRVGILGLMAAVALAAINLSVMRSWEPARGDGDISHYLYATGVLPMASVLIFVAMISARELASRGRASPFAVGFLATGTLAVFAFVTVASLDIKGLRDVGHGVLILAAPFLLRLFPNAHRSRLRLLWNADSWPSSSRPRNCFSGSSAAGSLAGWAYDPARPAG